MQKRNVHKTMSIMGLLLLGVFVIGCASVKQPAQHPPEDGDIRQHMDKADEFLDKGDLQSAIAEYTRAISIAPNDPKERGLLSQGYMRRGVAHARLKQYEQAVADFTRLIKQGHADLPLLGLGPDIYYSRGSVYLDMGETQKAIADFSSGIDVASKLKEGKGTIDFSPMLNRSLLQLHHIRAKVYTLITEEYEKALQDYDEALRLFPEEPILYRDRAQLYKAMGNESEASKDIERFESLVQDMKGK